MLQWFEFTKVCMGENTKRHFSRNFDIFSIKNDLPQCLVFFSIVFTLFRASRSLLSELSLFVFPLLRKSKGQTLHSGLTPARSEKKHQQHASRPNSSAELQYRVKRSLVKFQAKFISTAHATKLQIEESQPSWLRPTMDTFEARANCRANKSTLTRGRERTVQDRPCTLLHGPKGDF